MSAINEKLTRHVAELARLDLDEAEVKQYTEHLESILKYSEKLNGVDVTGVEPMLHPIPLEIYLREDDAEVGVLDVDGHPKVLSSAPEVLFDGFKVPPII